MSVNLHCKEMDLVQTPTWVTYSCYYSDHKTKTPADWKTIRDKYILWLRNSYQKEAFKDLGYIKEQIAQLKSFDKLTFYIV